jgi:hypothetical protein
MHLQSETLVPHSRNHQPRQRPPRTLVSGALAGCRKPQILGVFCAKQHILSASDIATRWRIRFDPDAKILQDGAPVRAESVPVRLFLSGFDLTPTYRNVNNKFSVKYYLNLVLVDEEDRRYFKQQEITLWRKEL